MLIDRESVPSKHGTVTKCWFNAGQRRRRFPSLKTALDQCLVGVVSCNQFADINDVSLYTIGHCWPTLGRPKHAHFAVG